MYNLCIRVFSWEGGGERLNDLVPVDRRADMMSYDVTQNVGNCRGKEKKLGCRYV